jgi:hypothetical protein
VFFSQLGNTPFDFVDYYKKTIDSDIVGILCSYPYKREVTLVGYSIDSLIQAQRLN